MEQRSLITLLTAAKNSHEPGHRRGDPRLSAAPMPRQQQNTD
jgi:hypothetical protein